MKISLTKLNIYIYIYFLKTNYQNKYNIQIKINKKKNFFFLLIK